MSARRQLSLQLAWQVFPSGPVDLLSGQVCRRELVYPCPIDGISPNSCKNLQPLSPVLLLKSVGQKQG